MGVRLAHTAMHIDDQNTHCHARMIRFLISYAEQNALLPGLIPGYSCSDIKLLPSSVSKRGIWKVYHGAAEENDDAHAVAYSTFCRLWRTLLLSVQFFGQRTARRRPSPLPSRTPRSTYALSRSSGVSIRPPAMHAIRV